MLILDTSAILALLSRSDPHHRSAVMALQHDDGPFVIPAGIMAEAGYMIEARLGFPVLDLFLGDIEAGAFILDCGDEDLGMIRSLAFRYRDLPLGYADSAVAACALRLSAPVLTYDLRHFLPLSDEVSVEVITED